MRSPILFTLPLLLVACAPLSGGRSGPDPLDEPGWSDDDDDDDAADDDDAWGDDDDDDDGTPPEPPPEDVEDDQCEDAFESPQTRFLSADDSNSQADPAVVRALLNGGSVPSSAKAYEFLNYYDFDFEPAEPGHLSIVPELAEIPGRPGEYELLVGVVAPSVPAGDRAPLNLVFSVDTSCSMGGEPLARAKDSLQAVARSLVPGDVVSMVTWSTNQTVELDSHAVNGPADPTLTAAIAALSEGGGTDLESGLEAAYALAEANYRSQAANRVVLVSDGGANVGVTEATLIAEHAEDGQGEGIYLVGVGVPPALGYRHDLMDDVTDLGKGAYLFIDSAQEAEERFSPARLPALFQVAARDVQLAVTLPPGFVIQEFTGEEIGATPSEVEPQHLAPNDQMLYDMNLLDCSPDAASGSLPFLFTVEWVHPQTGELRVDTHEATLDELLAGSIRRLTKATAIVAFAEAFATVRSLPAADAGAHLDAVQAELAQAAAAFPQDPDLAELLSLLASWRARYP